MYRVVQNSEECSVLIIPKRITVCGEGVLFNGDELFIISFTEFVETKKPSQETRISFVPNARNRVWGLLYLVTEFIQR